MGDYNNFFYELLNFLLVFVGLSGLILLVLKLIVQEFELDARVS